MPPIQKWPSQWRLSANFQKFFLHRKSLGLRRLRRRRERGSTNLPATKLKWPPHLSSRFNWVLIPGALPLAFGIAEPLARKRVTRRNNHVCQFRPKVPSVPIARLCFRLRRLTRQIQRSASGMPVI